MRHDTKSQITRREFLEKSVKSTAAVAVSAGFPTLFSGCAGDTDADFDVLIKNGTVYDGTLKEPFVADIGIKGDRISAVGHLTQKASRIIDAAGKMVTPGFIDIHTHCDLTFQIKGIRQFLAYLLPSWKGNYNYLYQGVTTVVTGNCGYGYSDIEKWFEMADSVGFGTNVYSLVPHGKIREVLFGQNQPRQLDFRQRDTMEHKVAEQMEKGAVGISSGLEYAPGYLATTDELIALCRVVRRHGGLYTTHMRDETGAIYPDGEKGIIKSVKEAIEIGRRAEIPVEISHLKISEPINHTPARQVLDLIEHARMQGLDIHADQYPYAAGSTIISHLLPNEMKTSQSIKDEFKTRSGKLEIIRVMEETFRKVPPEKTMITMYADKTSYEGKTIKEIAEQEGRRPSESYADMVCEENLPMAVYFFQDIRIVTEMMAGDYMITASDGWTVPKGFTRPHPRVYGTFPRKLRKFVLEEKRLSLPAAIRSMTSLPAEKFRVKGRGKIETGYFADIAVLDPNTIRDHATYKDPHQYSEGVTHLIVNGVISIDNGKATGNRGGRTIKRT